MGRHADPDPRHFWVSFGTAAARALAALALVVALFAVLATVGGPPEDGPAMMGSPDSAADIVSSPGPEREPDPDPEPDGDPHAEPEPPPDAEAGAPAPDVDALLAAAPPPQDTTVQVLDGVGASPNLPAFVSMLESLGYQVVAVNPARVAYTTTTVLFSQGSEDAARALQARHPPVAELRENPGLSEAVDLHVVLGADWKP